MLNESWCLSRLTWDTEKCLLSVLSGLILEKIYELFIVSNKTVGYIYNYIYIWVLYMHKFILLLVKVVVHINCLRRQASCSELIVDYPFVNIIFKKGKSIIKSVIQNNVKLKRFRLNGYIHRVLFTNIEVMSEVLFLSI